ncbi:MAG: NADH-quinone oxidoreductase subunit C [Cytophagaceae bacterium]|nr:NADH-quinone oxidoreductase subunit C [Cytophagaceae bacterium]
MTTTLNPLPTIPALTVKNGQSVALDAIPVLSYGAFSSEVLRLLSDPQNHCVNYYAFPDQGGLKFIAATANDGGSGAIYLLSHETPMDIQRLDSLTKSNLALHIYEREIAENFGIEFVGHPWAKPVRYAHDRADRSKTLRNYPFFKITGEEIHEVPVGPIHAGVIEPGHFRFMCNGETVLHLEIQLGYQHRGIEKLFLQKKTLIQRTVLAECIAGDTAIGHNLAFVQNMESLAGIRVSDNLQLLRTLALEIERLAMHTWGLSNLGVGIAYQLGNSVIGALRTPVINYMQWWCGNRFGKGLLRVGCNQYPFTAELKTRLLDLLDEYEAKYTEIAAEYFDLPSVQAPLEKTGTVTQEQMRLIGAVGMSARITGIPRDIRQSHPTGFYEKQRYETVTEQSGDVWARAMLRNREVQKSLAYIRLLLENVTTDGAETERVAVVLEPNQFSIALTEAWRGEVCHCAVTDASGELAHYKVKDPSVHNWLALGLAVRDNEISDFPICNKTFDLSYCGNDL